MMLFIVILSLQYIRFNGIISYYIIDNLPWQINYSGRLSTVFHIIVPIYKHSSYCAVTEVASSNPVQAMCTRYNIM
jgi:hypothetical protein